jgi:plasmid maintenance system antidote protein VapI
MEAETTTEATVEAGGQHIDGIAIDDQGMALPQPEETEQAEAVQTTNEPEEQTAEETEPSEDEQLSKFAEVKGLQLDSENAKKAAKMAMNAEKLMHTKANRASELERTMSGMSDDSAEQVAQATGQDPEVLKRLQRMEVKDSIREFWDANPDARQYEAEMAKIAVESGLYGSPEAILKASYAIAASDSLRSQGKKEALTSLAHKQQAAVPRGNAVTSSMTSESITPQNVDRLVAQHDQSWFESNYAAINKAMAG